MTQHVNLMFATPGHSLMAQYVKSLLPTIQVLNQMGISWGYTSEYSSHVADAREITLNGSKVNNISDPRPFGGQLTYDKIMWIDSDIAWKPEDVLKLYNSDKDVIGGAYMISNGDITAYRELFGPGFKPEEVKAMTEPVKVFGLGFGFACIKSGVFEKLQRPWFQQVTATKNIDGQEFSFPLIGEDLSLCHRLGELGVEIWFDPTVRVTHHKMVTLGWDGEMKPL